MNEKTHYESPFSYRYASKEMSFFFSPQSKFLTWRRIWIALARAEKKLGIPITDAQIAQLEDRLYDIDFNSANEYEKKFRHDVMAHLYAFGDLCPSAKPILHLGATSCTITDNADLLQIREALKLLKNKCVVVIRQLADFANHHASLPCLSYTHFQPAQPTTVGKRACLWLQDFIIDLKEMENRFRDLCFLGLKGATGTQASFLELFNGDSEKVQRLEEAFAQELDFNHCFLISGQTYTRKQDILISQALCGLAATAHKFATDIRLLSNLRELEEPFSSSQVGSSAMPYKRNPMRSERVCGLARYLMALSENPTYTAATQWLERTLDDSANRRLAIPELFLSADAILNLLIDITSRIVVNPNIIKSRLLEELPFLGTEMILMDGVKKGGNRQELHEILRKHSLAALEKMKSGEKNDLLERIEGDSALKLSKRDLAELLQPVRLTGRAKEQVQEFLTKEVQPILKHYKDLPSPSPIEI